MDINDYARLRDHLEVNGAIRSDGTRSDFKRVASPAKVLRGSGPSAAKSRQYGTNGKLGKGRITAVSAGEYTLRNSRGVEHIALRSAQADIDIADLMASIGYIG